MCCVGGIRLRDEYYCVSYWMGWLLLVSWLGISSWKKDGEGFCSGMIGIAVCLWGEEICVRG